MFTVRPPERPIPALRCLVARRFDFSRRRASEQTTPTLRQAVDNTYQGFLRRTLPRGWTVDAEHIRLIAEHLDAVDAGQVDRLAIHMPPRHGKTETVTVRYPAKYLAARPADNVLLTGYNERFARRLGRKSRNVAISAGLELDPGKAAADEWATAAGGVLMTRGVGSPPTGIGFHRIVVDDPVRRREDAESEVYREKCWDWYTDDLYTRLEPGGAIVLIATLWHEDDVCARAVASEPGRWTVLKLPAISDEGRPLWPERYDLEALERIRDVMAQNEGLRGWEALYQQRPSAREGAFFKVTQLELVDAAPAGLSECRAWDLAATAADGDHTAGVKLGGPDPNGLWYVLDVVRGQWATDERNAVMRQTAALDGSRCRVRLAQDPGQAGVDQAKALTRMLAGTPVRTARVSGEKTVRADPVSAQVNAGNVRLVKGAWNRAFIEELRLFPQGKADDQVDAFADAFNEMTQKAEWSFF